MKKISFNLLKAVAMFFWRLYMQRIPTPHPHGIPYERDPEAPCEFYEPFKRRKWYFQDCETDGHYLCGKCIHNVKHAGKVNPSDPPREFEFPCENCHQGEMMHKATHPNGQQYFECENCGYEQSFP